MTANLTIHNAEITTATVEIRTLTVSGKQVTLALFRQLEESRWLDDAGEPRGPAWGRVNYCPGRSSCARAYVSDGWNGRMRNDEPHVHLVWQFGTELRRYAMDSNPRYPFITAYADEGRVTAYNDKWAAAYRLAWQLPQLFIAV